LLKVPESEILIAILVFGSEEVIHDNPTQNGLGNQGFEILPDCGKSIMLNICGNRGIADRKPSLYINKFDDCFSGHVKVG